MSGVLFEPFRLHDLTLPNRIALSPMTRSRAGAARLANQAMAEYYTQRSAAGLLINVSMSCSCWRQSASSRLESFANFAAASRIVIVGNARRLMNGSSHAMAAQIA